LFENLPYKFCILLIESARDHTADSVETEADLKHSLESIHFSSTEGVSKSNSSTSQSLVLETLTPDPIVDSSLGSSTGQHVDKKSEQTKDVLAIDTLPGGEVTKYVLVTRDSEKKSKQENKCENL